MNKSNLFKAAHKLAKSVIQAGDNYQATFALCLKAVYAQSTQSVDAWAELESLVDAMDFNAIAHNDLFLSIVATRKAFSFAKEFDMPQIKKSANNDSFFGEADLKHAYYSLKNTLARRSKLSAQNIAGAFKSAFCSMGIFAMGESEFYSKCKKLAGK